MFDAQAPARSYLVCATPRSGSTLLCELLRATGVAGNPEEPFEALRSTSLPRQPREYFDGFDDPAIDALPPVDRGREETAEESRALLADGLRRGTTPNGVFGAKLMWGYFPDFVARVRALPGCADLDAAGAIGAFLPGVRYVRVVREDKVAQAVSLWRALQTQQWRHEGDAEAGDDRQAEYSYAAIAHLVDGLTADEEAWREWFAGAGIAPVEVDYDHVAASPRTAVRAVLDALGLDAGAATATEIPMRRQSDARSDQWIRSFHRERMPA